MKHLQLFSEREKGTGFVRIIGIIYNFRALNFKKVKRNKKKSDIEYVWKLKKVFENLKNGRLQYFLFLMVCERKIKIR